MRYAMMFVAFLLSSCTAKINHPKQAEKWEQECYQAGPTGLEYCINKTGGKIPLLIVNLHGLADGVKSPKSSVYPTEEIADLINQTGASHMINLSYGKAWMLRPEGAALESVTEWETNLLKLQKEYKLPEKMVAMGMSMGGHNLATICAVKPDLFKGCVLLNPMILRADQWKEKFEVKDAKDAALMAGKHFTEEEWKRFNPLALLTATAKVGNFFVTACRQDDFKLFEATEAWAKAGIAQGKSIVFKANDCDHFTPNIEGAAAFIQERTK